MISQDKRNIMIATGAATLVLIGGIATFWGITSKQSQSQGLLGSELLPENTLMAISVTTDERQWTKLRQFGTPESQKIFDGKLTELRDRFLTANGYNYVEDMQPWVGREITIGFLPPPGLNLTEKEKESTPPTAPGTLASQSVVMVLPIANAAKAKQFLASPKSVGQVKWVDRTYQGIEIKETVDRIPENYSISVIGGKYLAIANSSEAINRAIDTYKKGSSLREGSGVKQAWANLDESRAFAQFYVNIPVAAAVTALQLDQAVSPQSLASVQQQQGMATNVMLEPEGIRFQSIAWLKADSDRKYPIPKPGDSILNRLPSETSMVVSGENLQQLWQDYIQGTQTNPLAALKPDWLPTAIKNTTKLDLEKDLLSWMAGQFALGLVAAGENNNDSKFQSALVFMVKASDRRAGENIFRQLDQVMAEQYNFKVEPGKIGEEPIVNWTSEYGALQVTHGWLDGDLAFLTFGAPLSPTFVPKPSNPLGMNQEFQQAVPSQLSPNNGQFFIDVERIINQNPPSWLRLPPDQKTMVNGIRSIGVTAANLSPRTAQYEIFVRLKTAGTPGPLPPAKD
ncbi:MULTISPECIES: DUF3352 domain-containing protein [Planktothricoides]|uniref:DUF3352 domain-containing protein n=2 Tax=Planktothricoides raciborskii TaxID=132608 RepID=A0AAU8JI03_9CYAN|nr:MULTISPECIES: DUF3352 domain-containing protein [Planktothricoides]KOR35246.1 hypothetical protein AM228_19440 [Planktothricoides sp. SR001]MBD2544819.1 DUF3352 domain-containing protein [Planktothricoides raciborskii FACHB-1370]MBD2582774.1 DUF3352 domain-containing protein [Planktothricoides raciborskii FACHB-1261]